MYVCMLKIMPPPNICTYPNILSHASSYSPARWATQKRDQATAALGRHVMVMEGPSFGTELSTLFPVKLSCLEEVMGDAPQILRPFPSTERNVDG